MVDKKGISTVACEEKHRGDSVAEIQTFVSPFTRVAVSAHTYPDGDAVGSCLAMANFLAALGKEVSVILPKKDIGAVNVLDGFDSIVNPDEYDFSAEPDLFVCLDCSEPSRICDERIRSWVGRVPTLNIDHHGKELFGNRNYVVNDASSTGELVFEIAEASGWKINPATADALWCALVTDTNRFTLPSVTAGTLRCAARLVECGARTAFLSDAIYMNEQPNVFDLRTRAMRSLERWCNGLVAAIALDSDDFAATGCTKQDAEEFPNIPRSIAGAKLSFYFYPFPVDQPIGARISVRSREDSPVTARMVAEHFGGAGHEHSAGAVYPGSVAATIAAVREYLETLMK